MDDDPGPSTSSGRRYSIDEKLLGIIGSDGGNSDSSWSDIEEPPKKTKKISNEPSVPITKDVEASEEAPTLCEQLVLDEQGWTDSDPLPADWVSVDHASGLKLYIHESGRVSTAARPYYLGTGSVRKHDIPRHAIPCLSYLYKTKEDAAAAAAAEEDTSKTTDRNIQTNELAEYCRKLFQFKKIRVMRFNSWSERRQFSKRRKHVHQLHKTAPLEPKVIIKCPVQSKDGESNKKWLMNTAGKSHVCILHEYVQHSLKKQPKYTFSELENAATPYAATVTINDMKYGIGYGTSKKQAKSNAAKATLEILIPEMQNHSSETDAANSEVTASSAGSEQIVSNISFFDSIQIMDTRVTDFCVKTTEPLPCDLLNSCLNRNQNLGNMNITYEGNGEHEEMLRFTMTVGPHQATVKCKNKREAKQQAAQAILQKLHPHVHSWGALLRLYGSGDYKGLKEKLTQKPTGQSAVLHTPQQHTVPSPMPTLNEQILAGLRNKFTDLLATTDPSRPYGTGILSE